MQQHLHSIMKKEGDACQRETAESCKPAIVKETTTVTDVSYRGNRCHLSKQLRAVNVHLKKRGYMCHLSKFQGR